MFLHSEDGEIVLHSIKKMDREELKANYDYWEEEAVWAHEVHILEMLKHELDIRNQDRQYQIKMLNQSLLASSIFGRWLSHGKAFLSKFVEIKY